MKNRIYAVGAGTTIRLVRAPNRAQALAHVARSTINVTIPSQDELVKLVTAGTQVEDVKADTAELFEEAAQ